MCRRVSGALCTVICINLGNDGKQIRILDPGTWIMVLGDLDPGARITENQ
jgi:hypothetical protein